MVLLTHPAFDIKGAESDELSGKKIVLGITGSIAAVETVKLARELMRFGADVHAVMSPSAEKIIHPHALQYATGHEVITELTGKIEHVELCGCREDKADLLLIAPCTANTIGKIAAGIDDTSVTTFATTALGSGMPIVIAPAMHSSMYSHPIVMKNIRHLKELGIVFMNPRMEEGSAKLASIEDIVLCVLRVLDRNELKGKKVLITAGGTAESIDPIRILTSRSSGKTGLELAREAYIRGADVKLVQRGHSPYSEIESTYVESAQQMTDAVLNELRNGFDVLICPAAISDYTVDKHPDKASFGKEQTLSLKPVPKMIELVRKNHPDLTIIGFKAETNVSVKELISRARSMMDEYKLDLVVANDVGKGGIGEDENEVYILSNEIMHVKGSKSDIAKKVIDALVEVL
ncbi:MAG: bifunctional phosphopantothenoylcysteine decarboxylase/phosphopantothenate--cysteine ligase CoaBC [Methanocellales archaeon]|nr:bifunctional phosphopantothenoylcysteine decarboxylase/phosphopantothenate--cysteine ligase CoaBC [Methanocellales archaeon]MDD3291660.1 bifunctional phosphopantothenoylcysteine decarboxylase/phosphopantothenate--cysteine ligase CoaBC [Methanocellales archaeon]MDD5235229.1 bifunctional phosphopantothenoylcysteine decarboxylase/phosphopantothenate--cysteine ligase CoaBC [Methanocellales archaeon]MDD5485443.1 bifunctional phosphopantothenoylcysteine decarboxylase/phosphopantothenate--cysteine l